MKRGIIKNIYVKQQTNLKVNPFWFDQFYRRYLFGISSQYNEVHPYRQFFFLKSRFSINAISLSLSEVHTQEKKNSVWGWCLSAFYWKQEEEDFKRVIKWTILLFILFSRCNKKDRKKFRRLIVSKSYFFFLFHLVLFFFKTRLTCMSIKSKWIFFFCCIWFLQVTPRFVYVSNNNWIKFIVE